MQKWEYLPTIHRTPIRTRYVDSDTLSSFGEEGWELVYIEYQGPNSALEHTYFLIFKRPKHEQLSQEPFRPGDTAEVSGLGKSERELSSPEEGIQLPGSDDRGSGEQGEEQIPGTTEDPESVSDVRDSQE